ncbi:lantibiotic dehydratase [Nonomuraea sp. NPDC049269]|uniref:lantibiotic dehydratase n=1 Tax=Nonomuraea sp. NPDC049269 TaxID=3364349 RepID=UPI003720B50E
MPEEIEFAVADFALLRTPALSAGHAAVTLEDLDPDDPGQCDRMIDYLRRVSAPPLVREALEVSSRSLARILGKVERGEDVSHARLRRAIYAVTKYVLRMSTRPTPFGLLAGVEIAGFGDRTRVSLGGAHRKAVRPDMDWLLAVVRRWERDPEILRGLRVVVNDLAQVRGDRLVLPYIRADDQGGHAHETSVRHSAAVRRVCELAGTATPYAELVALLTAEFPEASEQVVESMLAELVRHEFLLTDLRPPSYGRDPVRHVLDRVGAREPEAVALAEIDRALQTYARRPPGEGIAQLRAVMTAMDRLRAADQPVQVDLRVDARVTLPAAVVNELEHAVTTLRRVTADTGLTHLSQYHEEFVEKYGIDNPVPLKELLDPARGLGPPAGYLRPSGSRRPAPHADVPSGRARLLAELAQQAGRDGRQEVLLEADHVRRLSVNGADAPPSAMELPVTVLADSARALDEGDFRLVIPAASGSSQLGAFFGRFLHLFADSPRPIAGLRDLHTTTAGAVAAQLTFQPHRTRLGNVSQVPRVLDQLVSVGVYVADPGVLGVDDLAVYADLARLRVLSLSLGREIRPMPFHLMNLYTGAPNAARLLAEISQAGTGVWRGWQWGSLNHLPFLPRVRYGRTVVASARWLPPASLRDPARQGGQWPGLLDEWRARWAVPDQVEATLGDQRITLDLTSPLHRGLLRRELARQPDLVLHERPCGGEPGTGWLHGLANEVVVPFVPRHRPPSAPRAPVRLTSSRPRHLPGGQWLYAKLYVPAEQQDDLLATAVPPLINAVRSRIGRWYFLRYADPDPHLRLRFHAGRRVLPLLHDWARDLCDSGRAQRLVLDTYEPEVARYGGEKAMELAEQVFHADSEAVLAQLRLRLDGMDGLPSEVLAAANYVDILRGLGDESWQQWLLANYPKGAHHHAFRRHREPAMRLIDPAGDWHALRAYEKNLPALWAPRSRAVSEYGEVLRPGEPSWTTAVNSLLHMHHNRLVGVDRETESASYAIARGVVRAAHDRRAFGT